MKRVGSAYDTFVFRRSTVRDSLETNHHLHAMFDLYKANEVQRSELSI